MFDLTRFVIIWLIVLPLMIVGNLTLIRLLRKIDWHVIESHRLWIAVNSLFAPGVIMHEGAHALFCLLFGVEVIHVNFFIVSPFASYYLPVPYGGVRRENVESVLVAFHIATAPIIVNGLLVATLCYYLREIAGTVFIILAIYLIIALTYGAIPSSRDLYNFGTTLIKHWKRGSLEILLLVGWGVAIYKIITLQVPQWGVLTVLVSGLILNVVIGRMRMNETHFTRRR